MKGSNDSKDGSLNQSEGVVSPEVIDL
jgi:ABC-type multidrug transport system ATPase subunit